jgi:multicomponent Na+:H+ antiporter subunit A
MIDSFLFPFVCFPPMTLLASILLLWAGAVAAPLLHRGIGARAGWVLALLPLALCAAFLATLGGPDVRESLPWYGSLGAALELRLDGLSRLMALLICGVGSIIVLYSSAYLGKEAALGRFFLILLLFMGSMLGLVLADNLILLFVFWELTSITSYLLIGFNHETAYARKNALQALTVTGLGGLSLLAGLVLIGMATGQWRLTGVVATGDLLREHAFYPAILVLVLVGAFTKSAQFPFHFWLPNAMAGPTPVSAYLHSATMVKAGVFLLMVLAPVLGNTAAWEWSLILCGATTFLLGAIRGAFQTDLKRVLAFTTLSVLGLLVLLLGLDFELATQSAILFLLGHALYKGALFMVVGTLDHETGTREAPQLGGLRGLMPITALAGLLAALSKGGFPPLFGFLGKEYVYKAGVAVGDLAPLLLGVAVMGNAVLLALAFKVGIHPFWGKDRPETPKRPHEAPFAMWLGPLLLGMTGLLMGLFPGALERPLVEPALAVAVNRPVELELALWHGVNVPLLLSILTVTLGLSLYGARRRIWRLAGSGRLPRLFEADAVYAAAMAGTARLARWQTGVLQSGKLRNYLLIILGAVGALLVWKLRDLPVMSLDGLVTPVPLYFIAFMLLMMGSTIMVLTTRSKGAALLGLGIVGFGISLLFLYFGAPDLAITQIVVETLSLVLLFLILSRIPELSRVSRKRTLVGDALVAAVAGLLVTVLVLKADLLQVAPSISEQFHAWSYPLAKGRNVVNVILVDFRALDTYGEIIVLMVAALGVAALMRHKGGGQP